MLQLDEVLKRANVHSLMVPGLCRRYRGKWLMYLLSGFLKLSLVTAIPMLLSTTAFPKAAIIVSSLNSALFLLSGLLDLVVFFSTPESVPLQVDGYTVEATWFTTPFSNRHRLCVVANRFILVFSAITATICANPPIQGLTVREIHRTPLCEQLLYLLLLAGAFSPILTSFLWMSNQFRLICAAGAVRLCLGLTLIGIAARCVTEIQRFRSVGNQILDNLPDSLTVQVVTVYKLLAQTAYFAGFSAYIDYLLCLITSWTRSKKWIIWTVYFSVPVVCLLTASSTSKSIIMSIKRMFCAYDEIFPGTDGYPPHSTFANEFCQVMTNTPRLNGQHWLTSSLVILNIFHIAHAILLCYNPKWQPAEWVIVEHVILKSLRDGHAQRNNRSKLPSG